MLQPNPNQCLACGQKTHDGERHRYVYTWATEGVGGNTWFKKWIEPKTAGSGYICTSCSLRRIVSLRWRKELALTLACLGLFCFGLLAIYSLLAGALLDDAKPVEQFAGAGTALMLLAFVCVGALVATSSKYDILRVPELLGEYAWELDKPRLIAGGVPEKRDGLSLSGEGGSSERTSPEAFALVADHPPFRAQDRFRAFRIGVTVAPWFLVVYCMVSMFVGSIWNDARLWEHHPTSARFGLWLTASCAVVFNPILGLIGYAILRTTQVSARSRLRIVWALGGIVAVPAVVLGFSQIASKTTEALLMIGGAVCVGVLAMAWGTFVVGLMQLQTTSENCESS